MPQVRARIKAAGRAARHQPPTLLERQNRARPGRFARVLEHDINATALRQSLDLLRPIVHRIINRFISAEFARFRKFLIRPGCGDHARAQQFRDLDSQRTHAAARCMNQDIFAWLRLRARYQHVPGG